MTNTQLSLWLTTFVLEVRKIWYHKEVVQAIKSGIQLIAQAHLLHLERERIVSDMDKALLPIVGDDAKNR